MALGAGEAIFDLGGVSAERANLAVGAGELALEAATAPFAVGELTVSVGTGEATYDLGGATAERVSLATGTGEITITASAPIDIGELAVSVGLGKTHLDLRQSRLLSATVSVGLGEVLADLRADWQQDTHATFETGLGNITLILPEEVGVRVRVRGGFGIVEAAEFAVLAVPEDEEGTVYVNTAYATSPLTVDVIAQRGLGNVYLLTEEPVPVQGVP
jgi:hypothetical protein